ncbi:MAG: SGNH/GDSL hydrolase family protein [Microcoleaceae cyanobacterium]
MDASVPVPTTLDGLPTVSFEAYRNVIIEGGEPQLLTFTLSQPAPAGGLEVKLGIEDPDGSSGPGDTNFPPELISYIVDFGQVEEDGVITASLTIAEGATVATFGIAAFEDDQVEGDETYTLTLLEDENYIADPMTAPIVTTIEDTTALPTVGISPEVVTATEGETFAWNFSLDQPAPVGGLSVFLSITENNDPAPGDVEYFVAGSSNITDFEFVTTTESVSQIYAFGDSYTEDGLSLELSTEAVEAGIPGSFILPADPALGLYDPEGRWTNGPTAVEVLSETLEVDLTNYAVGGAKSGSGNYYDWLDSIQDTGVFGQIDQFSTELAGEEADPDALYFIFASANDLFEFTDFGLPGTAEEVAAQAVENIVEGITDLSELGAEQFLVVNSSDLDILPGIIEFGQVEEATEFTDEVNELLPEALEDLGEELGIEIALYDHVAISDEIRANPEDFGLTNVDDPYQPVFPVEPTPTDAEPDEYYFWDEYHPTARTHEIIGEDMASFVGSEFGDEVSTGFNLTIAEGAMEAVLVSEVIADDIEEGEENFTTVIADGVDYRANPAQNQVVTNLLEATTEPTISVFAEPTEVEEGTQLLWNFSLTEAVPAGGLAVDLDLVEDTDPLPGDITYFVAGSENVTDFELVIDETTGLIDKAVVTLAEGATSATLVNDIIADNATEGPESVSFELAESEEYDVDPEVNAASFTILDTSTAEDGTFVGTDGDDQIAGGFGNDDISGGAGNDLLRGDLDERQSVAEGGNDTISGGAGNDRIGGKAGNDVLFGDEGSDRIWGDQGDDLLSGGLGNDVLHGDSGSLFGGADTFVLAAGEGTDTIMDFEVGLDLIGLDDLTFADLTFESTAGNLAVIAGDETLAIVQGVNALTEDNFTTV